MIAISSSGTFLPNIISENTSLGLGQGTVVDMRTVMYEIRKLPKMKVSLSRKIHIIGLPHGTSLKARWSEDTSATTLCQPSGCGQRRGACRLLRASSWARPGSCGHSGADEQIASPRSSDTSSAYSTTQTASRKCQ